MRVSAPRHVGSASLNNIGRAHFAAESPAGHIISPGRRHGKGSFIVSARPARTKSLSHRSMHHPAPPTSLMAPGSQGRSLTRARLRLSNLLLKAAMVANGYSTRYAPGCLLFSTGPCGLPHFARNHTSTLHRSTEKVWVSALVQSYIASLHSEAPDRAAHVLLRCLPINCPLRYPSLADATSHCADLHPRPTLPGPPPTFLGS